MQYKSQLFGLGGALIFINHSAVGVLCSLICILATYESKPHRPGISLFRRGDRPADAASVSLKIAEPIPVNMCRFQSPDKYAAGPIRCLGNSCVCGRDNLAENLIFRDLQDQFV